MGRGDRESRWNQPKKMRSAQFLKNLEASKETKGADMGEIRVLRVRERPEREKRRRGRPRAGGDKGSVVQLRGKWNAIRQDAEDGVAEGGGRGRCKGRWFEVGVSGQTTRQAGDMVVGTGKGCEGARCVMVWGGVVGAYVGVLGVSGDGTRGRGAFEDRGRGHGVGFGGSEAAVGERRRDRVEDILLRAGLECGRKFRLSGSTGTTPIALCEADLVGHNLIHRYTVLASNYPGGKSGTLWGGGPAQQNDVW
ncbi:hypothetical protein Tco_0139782 [Tanacetum coccineum]